MSELGRIESVQKMACPNCGHIIEEIYETSIIDDNKISCPRCGQLIRLPKTMIDKITSSKYIGTGLDITC